MINVELRELLEEKTGALFLIAGGFLLSHIAVRTLPNYIALTVQERLPGWAGFIFSTGLFGLIGLAIPFVALFGLYHHLTSKTPRLAVAGGALMALTPILYLSGLLTVLIRPLPEVPYLLWLSPLPYMMGAGSFGLAFLRKNGPIRFVGIPLLVFSGTWTLMYTVALENGSVPGWLPFVELLAVSLIAMGYLLYPSSTAPNDGAPAGS
ncbi:MULTISPECIES: hypothetical protein [Halorussus]|uniref:hypothetical protein n=1 Tax=Halorussus TaxID=1070314 RepID=UPI0013B3AC8C|nr:MULTISPECIES: hypothetical protein [Halorussus]NHN58946.1 hypothetical protein [Halorussus sp. JP-T4]